MLVFVDVTFDTSIFLPNSQSSLPGERGPYGNGMAMYALL
jgi:hypothetical protein